MNFLHHYFFGIFQLDAYASIDGLDRPETRNFSGQNCTETSFSNSTGSVEHEFFQDGDGNSILTMFITPRVVWSSGLVLLPKRHKKDISGFAPGMVTELRMTSCHCWVKIALKPNVLLPGSLNIAPQRFTRTIRKRRRIVFQAIIFQGWTRWEICDTK